MKVFWNTDYTSIKHNFDTSRKSDNIIRLIEEDFETPHKVRVMKDIPTVEIVDPEKTTDISVTEKLINNWLAPKYVVALKTNNDGYLSESQGFPWCSNTYKFARAHTHGLVASVNEVLVNGGRSGSLSSGLHHASKSSGAGFCTINGVALSAIHAHEQGLEPIILDFDAHCGGGTMDFLKTFNEVLQTQNIIFGKSTPLIRHIDLSTNHFDEYDIGIDETWANLHVLDWEEDYLEEIQKSLLLAEPFITDKTVFIYNAGIDPIGSHGIDEEVIALREKIVSDFIGLHKAIFALAGGYSGMSTTRDDVAKTHLKTIYGWSWLTK
jgi:acetoin utilization deacetylase AcuC-like enzyme